MQSESAAQTQQLIQQTLQQAEDAKALAQYEAALDTHIGTLVESDPYLKATPYIEQVFKFEVMKAQPQTFEDLQAVLRSTAQAQVARYQQAELARRKVQAVVQSGPVTPPSSVGIEPPGGTALTPSPAQFFDATGRADWKALGRAVTASFEAANRAS
jgi:hypothetical protein